MRECCFAGSQPLRTGVGKGKDSAFTVSSLGVDCRIFPLFFVRWYSPRSRLWPCNNWSFSSFKTCLNLELKPAYFNCLAMVPSTSLLENFPTRSLLRIGGWAHYESFVVWSHHQKTKQNRLLKWPYTKYRYKGSHSSLVSKATTECCVRRVISHVSPCIRTP